MNVTDAELAISQLRNRADGSSLYNKIANRCALCGASICRGNVSALCRLPRSRCRGDCLPRGRSRRSRRLCHRRWRSLRRACVRCKMRRQRRSRYGRQVASSTAGSWKAADPTRSHDYLHSGRSARVSPHTALGRRYTNWDRRGSAWYIGNRDGPRIESCCAFGSCRNIRSPSVSPPTLAGNGGRASGMDGSPRISAKDRGRGTKAHRQFGWLYIDGTYGLAAQGIGG